jgi:anaerobic selenocysteine-containing dehydrogenase
VGRGFALIERRLPPLLEQHGRDALAVYLGNPSVHDHSVSLALSPFLRALGTKYRFSASTLDQLPKQVASGLMFGSEATVAIPDIDHTDYFLVLGANPLVSNGSMFTAADLPGRLRKLRERGGRLVVVDPRRTRTAEAADEHLAIRPSTDAFFLAALAKTLFDEGLVRLRDAALLDVGRRSTLVVFDYRRYDGEVVEFGKEGARRGAKVVLFTDPYLSPLASSATVLLTTVVDGPRPFLTLAPALAVVESIVLGVVEASGTRLRRRLESFDRLTAREPH